MDRLGTFESLAHHDLPHFDAARRALWTLYGEYDYVFAGFLVLVDGMLFGRGGADDG